MCEGLVWFEFIFEWEGDNYFVLVGVWVWVFVEKVIFKVWLVMSLMGVFDIVV